MTYKNFYSYHVYEDGRVYSTKSNRFLKGEITKYGYQIYALSILGQQKVFRINRLVAYLYLEIPENDEELVVNHKDGNKLNNHYSNLEWCTYDYNNYHARKNNLNNVSESNSKRWENEEFRKKTSAKFSKVQKENGTSKWKKNGRFRYDIYDIKGNNYSREQLAELLQLSQSYTDTLIKKSANGEYNKYFDKYGIYVKDTKKQGQSTTESVT